jgi:hypothetical protein
LYLALEAFFCLFRNDLSQSERLAIQFECAGTILHEFAVCLLLPSQKRSQKRPYLLSHLMHPTPPDMHISTRRHPITPNLTPCPKGYPRHTSHHFHLNSILDRNQSSPKLSLTIFLQRRLNSLLSSFFSALHNFAASTFAGLSSFGLCNKLMVLTNIDSGDCTGLHLSAADSYPY